jgi:hypothetical protein
LDEQVQDLKQEQQEHGLDLEDEIARILSEEIARAAAEAIEEALEEIVALGYKAKDGPIADGYFYCPYVPLLDIKPKHHPYTPHEPLASKLEGWARAPQLGLYRAAREVGQPVHPWPGRHEDGSHRKVPHLPVE